MSKFLKLKEWLTLDAAVLQLSSIIGETVTVADLYRFTLDGHLKLSFYFVNNAYAIKGKRSKQSDIVWEGRVEQITGIWDLTMQGQEALQVQEYYEKNNSGIPVIQKSRNGVLLQQDDVICQLYKYFEREKIFNPKYNESEERKRAIAEEPMKALENHPSIISPLIRKNKLGLEFLPSNKLAEEGEVLAIRKSEITRFIQSLEDTPQEAKPLRCKERNSLLVLIAALCRNADIDPMKRGVSSSLEKMTDELGAHLDIGTIRTILAQIEPAISSKS